MPLQLGLAAGRNPGEYRVHHQLRRGIACGLRVRCLGLACRDALSCSFASGLGLQKFSRDCDQVVLNNILVAWKLGWLGAFSVLLDNTVLLRFLTLSGFVRF